MIPDVERFKVDTLYGMIEVGSVPVLGTLDPGSQDSYCTLSEIDKAADPLYPWRTGDGTPGSGRVITDMEFVTRTVSDLRLNTDGTISGDSLARWNRGKKHLIQLVQKRFAQVAYATTDGSIVILHERRLLRAHIDFASDGIVSPLQFRVNLNTERPDGTHYEKWRSMNAVIVSIDIAERRKLRLTLNDSPVLPGFTSRRRRGSKGGRVY